MIRPQQPWANTSRLLVVATLFSLMIAGASRPAHAQFQTIINFEWDWFIEIVPRDPGSLPEDPTFGPPIPINLWGTASIAFGDPIGDQGGTFDLNGPVPDNGETFDIPIELVELNLISIDPITMQPSPIQLPMGESFVDIGLGGLAPSIGQLQNVRNIGNGLIQVDSFFDVSIDMFLSPTDGGPPTLLQNPEPLQTLTSFGTGLSPNDMGPLPEIDILWAPVWIWSEGLGQDLLDISSSDPLWDIWISLHAHTTLQPSLPGDGNGDGWVDGIDYLIWASNFGTHPGPDGDPSDGDYNDDGWIDGIDYLIWAGNFGTHIGTAVPEPSTLALGSLALVGMLFPRRRRR